MKLSMRSVLIIVLLASLLAACGGSASGIAIEGGWGRPSPKTATAGAFYMVIKNNSDKADKLVGAEAEPCMMVELHESFMNTDGTMGMRPVEGGAIEIPAKGQVELKVGGLHLMCMDKMDDMFTPGSKFDVRLKFENAGEVTVPVEIKAE
jgi:copper(I)-binding protein